RTFSVLLTDLSSATQQTRVVPVVTAVACFPSLSHPLMPLAFLPAATEPLPCRLSTQQLVNLLKLPTSMGEARRVILDRLGSRYQQRFATVWEFVPFAGEQGLDLDFTMPPQRPEEMKVSAIPASPFPSARRHGSHNSKPIAANRLVHFLERRWEMHS